MDDNGKVSVGEVQQDDLAFRTPRLKKFSKKSILAFSSWNQTSEGVGLEEVDASERRGFWDGTDLRLGAMTH